MTEHRTRERTRAIPNEDQHDDEPPAAPHDRDAERSLISAAILSTKALEVLATVTRPEDFYVPAHARLATVLTAAFEDDWPTDVVTIAAELDRRGWLDDSLTRSDLVSIQSAAPSTTSAPRYATIVHDHATLRRLLEASHGVTKLARGGGDAHAAVTAAQELVGGVAAQNGNRGYSTIEVADTADLLGTELDAEEADFLARSDGMNLLYAGKMHVFQAEPSTGKTWLALVAAAEILASDGAVLYLDWEDSSRGILGRLLALGANPSDVIARFQYAQPTGPFGMAEKITLDAVLKRLNPDLIVLDGVAEALARDGYDEDRAADVVAWGEKLPRWLSRTGAAVLMLDHVGKDKEKQGRWARGSGAKLGMVDGAAYSLKTHGGFSRKKSGGMRVVISKDRPGGVGSIGETAAMISIEPHADGAHVTIKVEPDNAVKHVTDSFRPTGLMAKVSKEVLDSTTPLTAKAVKSMIHTDKPKFVSEAIARLVAEGYLREARQGTAVVLVHVKTYDGDGKADGPALEDNPELPLDGDAEPIQVDAIEDLEDYKDATF